MFKKVLKIATLMTTVSFGALAKAQEFLPGTEDIFDALIALDEMSKEDCNCNYSTNDFVQTQETNDWMQPLAPEASENDTGATSLASTEIDLDEETEKLIEELSREQSAIFSRSSDDVVMPEEAVSESTEANLQEAAEIKQEETVLQENPIHEEGTENADMANEVPVQEVPQIEEEKTLAQENPIHEEETENADMTNEVPIQEIPQVEEEKMIVQENPVHEEKASVYNPSDYSEDDDSKNYLWILALLATIPGIYYLSNKLERKSEQKWKQQLKSMHLNSQPKLKMPQNSMSPKTPDLTAKPIVVKIQVDQSTESEQRQKGLRLLANNKAKRALLTKQKKALMNECKNPDISEERLMEIRAVFDSIEAERKKLSQERRQACALFKGKKGEALNNQRRLYAKKMRQLRRLMQKDGLPHLEEIAEINAAREALKMAEKHLMNEAKEEINVRSEKANWLHGIRSLIENQTKQQVLDQRIADLKKEKGLKKKEVLLSDFNLYNQNRQLQKEKRNALRLIKGRSFASQKNALTKQLKIALAQNNITLADEISKKYIAVKEAEKSFVKKSEKFDYTAQRIYMLNSKTAERIRKHRDLAEQRKERLEKANFLRGQRMLHYLRLGLVPSVNENRITPQNYRTEALKLLGAKAQIDYPRQRASYLKKNVLADIYLSKKEKGLL